MERTNTMHNAALVAAKNASIMYAKRGMSMTEIAEAINVDRTTVYRWAYNDERFAAALSDARAGCTEKMDYRVGLPADVIEIIADINRRRFEGLADAAEIRLAAFITGGR